jgi:hypothetical protein
MVLIISQICPSRKDAFVVIYIPLVGGIGLQGFSGVVEIGL